MNYNNEANLAAFESIRSTDETILWTDRPKFIPFALSGLPLGLGIILFLLFSYLMQKNLSSTEGSNNFNLWFYVLIPGIFLIQFFGKLLSYRNTYYAYSNKRVIIRAGIFAPSFKTIDFDKIAEMEVKVNFIEKLLKVGSIRFFSGQVENDEGTMKKIYDRWEAINDPYEVFKLLKKVTVDIKTDFQYPNDLRPETNSGYNTKYIPKG